jgi:UDP:flavonoid glycosyltransferase YjiC (YdhE family)
VRRVLDEPQFRARARELAAEMAGHDACAEGVALIEGLLDARGARSHSASA